MDKQIYNALPVFKLTAKEAAELANSYNLIKDEGYFFVCTTLKSSSSLKPKIVKALDGYCALGGFLKNKIGRENILGSITQIRLKWIEKLLDHNGYELVDA